MLAQVQRNILTEEVIHVQYFFLCTGVHVSFDCEECSLLAWKEGSCEVRS